MNTQNSIHTLDDCSACGACLNICPVQAVSFLADKKGFLLPHIDEDKCIDCNKCKAVCYSEKNKMDVGQETLVYAAVNKDKEQLIKSASGGAFSALASWALKNGYLVYGSAWDDKWNLKHICVSNDSDLQKLQGSKYVQSEVGKTFREIKQYLLKGKSIMFSGTPCQCDGLRRYLGHSFDNLVCIELICHGVPSAALFRDYIRLLEKKLKGKIIDLRFRDKKRGWGALLRIDYLTRSGKKKVSFLSPDESFYYSYYWSGYLYRDSCYNCRFAGPIRYSDLTIGDYWGVQKAHPEIDCSLGVSVVLSNTKKGTMILNNASEYLMLVPSDFVRAQKENGQLLAHSLKPADNDLLWMIYEKEGIQGLQKYYNSRNKKRILKGKIKRLMPLSIKRLLTRLILNKHIKG